MIYNKDYVLICPPKCGTFSVNSHLLSNFYWKQYSLIPHSPFIQEDILEGRKVLLIVRNPYERFISMYEFLRNIFALDRYQNFFKFNILEMTFKQFLVFYKEKRKSSFESFFTENFYDRLTADELHYEIYLNFLRSFKEYKKISKPDNIIKLENLNEDFKSYGVSSPFPELNKTLNKPKKSFEKYYTSKVLEKCDFLKEDALEFGYDVL